MVDVDVENPAEPKERKGLDDELVNSIESKITKSTRPSFNPNATIFRVPNPIREGDNEAYEPRVVSIGPYHRDKLKSGDEYKWGYVQTILQRNRDKSLKDYLNKIKEREDEARRCYSEATEISTINSNDFIKMLFRDGCFIVELFLKKQFGTEGDIIYGDSLLLLYVVDDLRRLENQIPYFILESIFEVAMPHCPSSTLEQLAVTLVCSYFSEKIRRLNEGDQEKKSFHHLLHLFHYYLLPPPQSSRDSSTVSPNRETEDEHVPLLPASPLPAEKPEKRQPLSIPSATKLQEAGVKFKEAEKAGSLLSIEFNKRNGEMEIPHLFIGDSTNLVFRNLIAFEQCRQDVGNYFSAYAALMDCIVDTPSDVEILRRKRILDHGLGSDEAVALLFNKMCKGLLVNFGDPYLSDRFRDVNGYVNTGWHTWRATLVRDYFSNPWAIISFAAAILLLLLTVITTVFAVLTYVLPPS